MNNNRSIEAQRARLLGKKSSSKPRSDKFVKKEIINMKYGLQKKAIPHKTNIKTFYISVAIFCIVFLGSFLFVEPILSFIFSLVSFFVSLGILNMYQAKAPNKETYEYNINYVFENYDSLLVGELKERMISIKGYVDELATYELPLIYKHYIQSTVFKDIPELFNNFSHIKNSEESYKKLLEQLVIIENKLLDIKITVQPNYEQKLEVKARVIKEKANI